MYFFNFYSSECIIFFLFLSEDVTTYSNLATDETLFEGRGDYQFDIYRKMKQENGYVDELLF